MFYQNPRNQFFIFSILLLFNSNLYSQELFKGLELGMSKKEAKKIFKKNKNDYTLIDLGSVKYATRPIFFNYDENGLISVSFYLKNYYYLGSLIGADYDDCVNALNATKSAFEELGYTVYYKDDYWNAPISFRKRYGLIMIDKGKKKIAHIRPLKINSTSTQGYMSYLTLMNYDVFMKNLDVKISTNKNVIKKSGF